MSTSLQEARAFTVLQRRNGWITSAELAEGAEIGERTARMYAARFVQSGIAEVAKVFPAWRYRIRDECGDEARRILQACKVFGL